MNPTTATKLQAGYLFRALDADGSGRLQGKEIPKWVATGARCESLSRDQFELRLGALVDASAIDDSVIRDQDRYAEGLAQEQQNPGPTFIARVAHFFTGLLKGLLGCILTPFVSWFTLGRTIRDATFTNAKQDLRDSFESHSARIHRETVDFRREVGKEKLLVVPQPLIVQPLIVQSLMVQPLTVRASVSRIPLATPLSRAGVRAA